MLPSEQAYFWLAGIPVHNVARDECCPDFSCCDLDRLASFSARQAFVAYMDADDDASMTRMLEEFLTGGLHSWGFAPSRSEIPLFPCSY